MEAAANNLGVEPVVVVVALVWLVPGEQVVRAVWAGLVVLHLVGRAASESVRELPVV